MPRSTSLYHDTIKTVASSDDNSPPAHSPNLPSINNMPGVGINAQNPQISGPNPVVLMPTLGPMGTTQPLYHSNQMPSPNAMDPTCLLMVSQWGLPGCYIILSWSRGPKSLRWHLKDRWVFPQYNLLHTRSYSLTIAPVKDKTTFPGEGSFGCPSNMPQSSALCKPGGSGGS